MCDASVPRLLASAIRQALLTGCLVVAFGPTLVRAQTPTEHVVVRDLTVEGRDPPRYLRDALDDNTRGVMRGFERCFAERSRLVAGLAGELPISMYVSAQQVIRVTPGPSTFADDELTACIKRTLLAFALPPEAPRGGATVRMRVAFTPVGAGVVLVCDAASCAETACGALAQPCCAAATCGAGICGDDAVCVVPPPPPPPPPPPVTLEVVRSRGGFTVDELRAALHPAALSACRDGTATGRVPMNVTVSRTGRVTVTALRGTLRDRATLTCLRTALRTPVLEARPRTTYARVEITVASAPDL